MKIALCQINPTVGDFDNNCKKILSFYSNSVDANADIAVFPELSITGYPPQDLLLERSFVDRNVQVLEVLRSAVGNVPMVVGYVQPYGTVFIIVLRYYRTERYLVDMIKCFFQHMMFLMRTDILHQEKIGRLW